MYKAILKNTKNEIVDYRICNSKNYAVKQCIEWQLKHEYDFYETEIQEIGNTITYSDKESRSHNHKLIIKK